MQIATVTLQGQDQQDQVICKYGEVDPCNKAGKDTVPHHSRTTGFSSVSCCDGGV